MKRVCVTGAGGFIGHHLVNALKADGCWVRGVDLKYPEFGDSCADEFMLADLRKETWAAIATAGVSEVYALAADMGGMGYISFHDADILTSNLLISVNTARAAADNNVAKLFYSSSACVYPDYRQDTPDVPALAEDEAYPAAPQDGYGWEKLTTEKLLIAYRREGRLDVRIGRFHAIYGPLGTWRGGREKAPAALCRKVAEATEGGVLEIWGDGQQTRSFCYISDCIEGIQRLMDAEYWQPLNVGSAELVTIDELADTVMRVAGKKLQKRHVPGPQGVRGRNSDNSRIMDVLGWAPEVRLEEGLRSTYGWIASRVVAQAGTAA